MLQLQPIKIAARERERKCAYITVLYELFLDPSGRRRQPALCGGDTTVTHSSFNFLSLLKSLGDMEGRWFLPRLLGRAGAYDEGKEFMVITYKQEVGRARETFL